mgnify:CR=1 FL=1
MKLVPHQLIAADPAKVRSRPEGSDGEAIAPVHPVARSIPGSAYDQGQHLPRHYEPKNLQAINFYNYTASLNASAEGGSGELIGVDTYA